MCVPIDLLLLTVDTHVNFRLLRFLHHLGNTGLFTLTQSDQVLPLLRLYRLAIQLLQASRQQDHLVSVLKHFGNRVVLQLDRVDRVKSH